MAGNYRAGYGTPFDLDELAGTPGLNVNAVTQVRVVDVVGCIQDAYCTHDSLGNKINDPWPTDFSSSGFDLNGVGVINVVPEPGTLSLTLAALMAGAVWTRRRRVVRLFQPFTIFNHSTTLWRLCSMKTSKRVCVSLLVALVLGLGSLNGNARGETTVNFSDLSLNPSVNPVAQTQYALDGTTVTGHYWNGPDPNGTTQPGGWGSTETIGQFTSAGVAFPNIYNNTYGSWTGWAYSNVNDRATPGSGNQYAAYSPTGGGINGTGSTYAVAYGASSAYGTPPTITLPAPTEVLSTSITNTTYAYLSMLNGDSFAKKFTSTDWFTLTISGFDANGKPADGTGPVSFNLATGTSFLTDWTTVNLTSLGNDVKSLQFDLTSSDTGGYGMNTPAYFALGGLTVATVPEPSAFVLLCAAGVTGAVWRYRRRCSPRTAALGRKECC